ncbi:MAG: hypothetical protein SGCHY_003320 [Lobulomycetales sp.]
MNLFQHWFFEQRPIRAIDFGELPIPLTLKLQDSLLKATLLHPLAQRYPASVEYRRSFAKKVYELVESTGNEPDERLLDLVIPDTSKNHQTGKSFKTYTLPYRKHADIEGEPIRITILEDETIVRAGSTGFRTWPSSFLMIEYFCRGTGTIPLSPESNVLDLGAGLGLLGLSIASIFGCKVTMADLDPRILARCRENVQLNDVQTATVTQLDWCATDTSRTKTWAQIVAEEFDLIVSADTVYDPDLLKGLVDTIAALLTPGPRGKVPRFLLAATTRTITTSQKFLGLLEAAGLGVQEVRINASSSFYYDEQPNLIRLVEIISF